MRSEIERRIRELKDLTIDQLRTRYEALTGEGSRSSNRRHLTRRIAWRIQAKQEPRRVLRYRPAPETDETTVTDFETDESTRFGEQEPMETSLRMSVRMKLEVTNVARNGDISFVWELVETTLGAAEGMPPPALHAMRKGMKSIEGRSGSGRLNARGINRDFSHDTPPPEEADVQLFFALITEIVEQVSSPLPKEPVGIGARWEVTTAKNHVEGVRLTQTVTYELESLGENEARLRMYIAVTALDQAFEHPGLPANANARLKRVHGDGEGELVIDFDRLGDRSLRMTVETRTELSMTAAEEEKELSVVRKLRVETKRE